MNFHDDKIAERLGGRYLGIIVAVMQPLFLLCTPVDQGNHHTDLDPLPGMVVIEAYGKSFRQGAEGPSSRADERPVFASAFAHDFCIDTTEVTIFEYKRITGKIPVQYDSVGTYDHQWPVCFVTWFDAVLYCNRRSVIDGFDTVYSYSAIDTTVKGNVYRLRGIDIDLRARGYRLPTEAEWEFAAHAGTDLPYVWGNSPESASMATHAWSAANSGGSVHPVAKLEKNRFGLYDMAGNVMEWVNDIKGMYPSGEVTDFLGAAVSPEDYRPVKSGSYKHSVERFRIANRSDDYETMSSTSFSYIGFRCAFGSIDSGVFSLNGETVTAMPPVRIIVPAITQVIPSNELKLVFVNRLESRRILCCVDFSVPAPKVVQYLDSTNVYCPVVSPDGKWVAYATRDDGVYGGSVIYVRALSVNSKTVMLPDEPAFSPRWWIDPSTNDTFIIYTNSTVRNTDPSWPGTVTKMQKVEGGNAVGPPSVIEPAGGYHDGRSKDGRYLASGYDRLYMKDLVTGESGILFTGPQNGKIAGDTSQVCNVSISPTTTDPVEVMLMDFGYPESSTVTHRPYAVHECIFICNFANQTNRWYAAPPGFVWSHPEWSTDPDFAAAGLEIGDGTHPFLGILNLKLGLFTEVLQGNDLLFPYLWVGNPDSVQATDLALDSAGYYNEPPSIPAQATLSWKLPLFWKHVDRTEVYFVGSSRFFHGIYPHDFSIYEALNMGANGADLQTALQIVRDYILNHGRSAKLIGVEVMIDWMDLKNGDQTWSPGFSNTRGFIYDRNNSFWSGSLPAGFTQLVARAPNYPSLNPDSLLGFVAYVPPEGWGGPDPEIARKNAWAADTQTCRENLHAIDSLGRELAKRGVHLLVVIMPQSPSYRAKGYFGRYGTTLQTASVIVDSLRLMERTNGFFHLYDAHNNGVHDYTDIDATNCDHLSEVGAHKITHRIDSLVNVILQ